MDIMKNLTVCLSKRFHLYKTSAVSIFPPVLETVILGVSVFYYLKKEKKDLQWFFLKKKKNSSH